MRRWGCGVCSGWRTTWTLPTGSRPVDLPPRCTALRNSIWRRANSTRNAFSLSLFLSWRILRCVERCRGRIELSARCEQAEPADRSADGGVAWGRERGRCGELRVRLAGGRSPRRGDSANDVAEQTLERACVGQDIPDHVKKQFETGEYHGGPLKKEDFDKGHDGKTIEYFLNHESSQVR
eukprot:1949858-Rhodomonas_salina.2